MLKALDEMISMLDEKIKYAEQDYTQLAVKFADSQKEEDRANYLLYKNKYDIYRDLKQMLRKGMCSIYDDLAFIRNNAPDCFFESEEFKAYIGSLIHEYVKNHPTEG